MGETRSAAAASGHEAPQGAQRAPHPTLDGDALREALTAGAEALREQADAINAINVFPVPDGDTGTNMHMTMRAAVEELARSGGGDAASALVAAAQGALMGAKGNSGVILSQILAGMAAAAYGTASLDAAGLAAALARARDAAYRVVSAPKEGTILTAISAAAEGAAAGSHNTAESALSGAVAGARDAVARTPELLPVLKEAGVVDAGAQGLYVLLDGMLRSVRGERAGSVSEGLGRIDASWLGATQQLHAHGEVAGFCTEFVVTGDAIDAGAMRARLQEMGESVLVIGGGGVVRAHLHTADPEAALAYARTAGAVSHEKVDDMEAQFRALAAASADAQVRADGVAVVAVAAGDGLRALLASMGASVVHGGQTMNPSAGDIRAAIEATGASSVIVLPNNKNIIMAARQAADGLKQDVRVLQTRSVAQGVAALVAMNTELPLDENAAAMAEAAAAVRSGEVTLAARATRLHGIEIAAGQPIGIIDGELAVAEATVAGAVRACVEQMLDGREHALITLYAGEGEDEASREALAQSLREEFGAEVEALDGGQPHYPYFISLE